ncbi:MAG: ABC transporter ATP-binding protein [Spirochaetaceae bacterium]|nr:MAG: ABC transporter ATP-binding protein [Spirochaetaceae bacterium]
MVIPYSFRREHAAVPGAPAIETRDLWYRYPRVEHAALQGISISIPQASCVALIGSNGSGKSTLMKAICGILPPQRGTVRIAGLPIGGCHHRVAYLPQHGAINWRFPVTVRRLVLAGRFVHLGWIRRPGRRDYEIVDEALDNLGMTDLADRQIGMLSGGQQQRALLARALAQDAEVLLLDEPLTGVDHITRQVFERVINSLIQRGRTILTATHDTSVREAGYDTIFRLEEGELQEGDDDRHHL